MRRREEKAKDRHHFKFYLKYVYRWLAMLFSYAIRITKFKCKIQTLKHSDPSTCFINGYTYTESWLCAASDKLRGMGSLLACIEALGPASMRYRALSSSMRAVAGVW